MEVHQLRYMVAVARSGTFSRAAEQCHVSQPSLSQQIQKLEDELGERLFDRLRRQAKLTAAGEAFLPRAQRVLAELEAAQREAGEHSRLLRGIVTIGVLPTIAPYLLPDVIAVFGQAHPGVEVVMQEDTTAHLLELGGNGELDLIVASQSIRDERFDKEILFVEELLLALPANHSLAWQQKIRLADLEHERFILMREGHCLGDQVLNFCHRLDFHPQVSGRSTQIETILALVRTGAGISLVPKMVPTPPNGSQLVFRSLEKPRPQRSIVALWPRLHPLSRAASEILKCLRRIHPSSLRPQ
jgi:LysR family transcriptional regulator, hydrogen peroxide-inducible genes activator